MHPVSDYLERNLDSYLNTLKRMVEINSFTSNAEGVNQLGAFTSELFTKLNFDAAFFPSENPNFGNHLILRKPPSFPVSEPLKKATIALISHLDTVFSPEEEELNNFFWRKENERIYGPGTVDIKGGTQMIYMVLDAIREFNSNLYDAVNWVVALDACEETLSDEFGKLLNKILPEDTLACLVFEGGTLNSKEFPLVISRKGRATFQVRVEGRSAHAGNNHAQGANAILQISETIRKIESYTNYPDKLTFNVGTVNGGSVVNRIPHFAVADVEMRAFDSEVFETGLQTILSLNGTSQVASADGYPCKVTIEMTNQTDPWPMNQATNHLIDHWGAAAKELNLTVKPESRGGLSDGNLLWKRFPTLDGLGPTGGNAHCSERTPDGSKDQEFVLGPSFVPKATLNALAITRLIEINV